MVSNTIKVIERFMKVGIIMKKEELRKVVTITENPGTDGTSANMVTVLTPSDTLSELIQKLNELSKEKISDTFDKFAELADLNEAIKNTIIAENYGIRKSEYDNVLTTELPMVALIKKGVVPQLKLMDSKIPETDIHEYKIDTVWKHVDIMEFIEYADTLGIRVVVKDKWIKELELVGIYLSKMKRTDIESVSVIAIPDKLKHIRFEGVTDTSKLSNTTMCKCISQVASSLLGDDVWSEYKIVNADVKFMMTTCFKSSNNVQAKIIMPRKKTIIKEFVSVLHKVLTDTKYTIDVK